MVYCCVPNCKSDAGKKEKNVTFHKFPMDPVLKDRWRRAVNRQGSKAYSLWMPKSSSRICSKHFVDSDYSISTTKKILLPNTVPSIFIGYPTRKFKPVKPRKRPFPRSDVLLTPKKENNVPMHPHVSESTAMSPENVANSPPMPFGNLNSSPMSSENIAYSKLTASEDFANSTTMPSEEDVQNAKDIAVQVCSMSIHKMDHMRQEINKMRKCIFRLNNSVSKLKNRIKEMKESGQSERSFFNKKVKEMQIGSDRGDRKASLLLAEIAAYGESMH